MGFALGGVSWDITIRYQGKDDVAKAKQDVREIRDATVEATKAIKELGTETSTSTKAASKDLDAHWKAIKNVIDALGKQLEASKGVNFVLVKSAEHIKQFTQESAGFLLAARNVQQLTSEVAIFEQQMIRIQRLQQQMGGLATGMGGGGQGRIGGPDQGGGLGTNPNIMPFRRPKGPGIEDAQWEFKKPGGYLGLDEKYIEKVRFNINDLTEAIEKDKRKQKEKTDVNKGLTLSFDDLMTAIYAVGAALAALDFTEKIKEATLLAGRVENLDTVLQNISNRMGYTRAATNNFVASTVDLNITLQQARKGLASLAQSQIDLNYSTRLTTIAQDAAVIAGTNSSDAYERLVTSIQRTNTWQLRSLGILVNLNNVYRDYALETGKSIKFLSTYEKQQALLNVVMEKGRVIAGSYEAAMQDVYKNFTSLDRVIEETQRQFGEQFQPVFELFVKTVYDLNKGFQDLSAQAKATIAGVSAGTTVFVGLTVAVAGLAFAIKALSVALLSNPITAFFVGLSAAVAFFIGKQVELMAVRAAAVRSHQKAIDLAAQEADTISKLRKEYMILEAMYVKLASGQELSSFEQRMLNDAMQKSVDLLPKYRQQLNQLQNNPLAFAEFIRGKNPDVSKTPEERIVDLKEQIKIENELADTYANMKNSFAKELVSINANSTTSATDSRSYNEQLTNAQKKYKEFNDLLNASERRLEVLDSKLKETQLDPDKELAERSTSSAKNEEVSAQSALRIMEKFHAEREKLWRDSDAKIVEEHIEIVRTLNLKLRTNEEAEAEINARKRLAIKAVDEDEIRRKRELENKGFGEGSEEFQKVEEAGRSRRSAIVRQATDEIQIYQDRATKIKEALEKEPVLFKMLMEKMVDETDNLRARINERFSGISEKLIASETRRIEAERAFDSIREDLASADEERAKRKLTIQERLNSARRAGNEALVKDEQRNLAGVDAEIERAKEFNEILVEKARLKKQEATEAAVKIAREEVDRLQDDLTKLTEDRAKALGVWIENSLEGVRRLIEEQQKASDATEKFIRKLGNELAGDSAKGVEELHNRFDGLADAIKKATNPDQVNKIMDLAPRTFALEVTNATKEIEKLTKKLDDLRSKAELNFRQAREEFGILVAKGMNPQLAARIERDKLDRENFKVNRDAHEVQKKLTEEQKRKGMLQEEEKKLLDKLKGEADRRLAQLREQVDLKAREQEFLKKELALNEKITIEKERQLAAAKAQLEIEQKKMDITNEEDPNKEERKAKEAAVAEAAQEVADKLAGGDKQLLEDKMKKDGHIPNANDLAKDGPDAKKTFAQKQKDARVAAEKDRKDKRDEFLKKHPWINKPIISQKKKEPTPDLAGTNAGADWLLDSVAPKPEVGPNGYDPSVFDVQDSGSMNTAANDLMNSGASFSDAASSFSSAVTGALTTVKETFATQAEKLLEQAKEVLGINKSLEEESSDFQTAFDNNGL